MAFQAYFAPEHIDAPLKPRSGEELADVVDALRAPQDFARTFALILHGGSFNGLYAVAVNPGEDVGAVMFADAARGNLYSKGADDPADAICPCDEVPHLCYAEFGNKRYFPPGSRVPVADIKTALRQLFRDPTRPPGHLEWSGWEQDGSF